MMRIHALRVDDVPGLGRRDLRFEEGRVGLLPADGGDTRRAWLGVLGGLLFGAPGSPVPGEPPAGRAEIELTIGGRRLRVSRDFGAASAPLIDGVPADDSTPGEIRRLLGCGPEEFLRRSAAEPLVPAPPLLGLDGAGPPASGNGSPRTGGAASGDTGTEVSRLLQRELQVAAAGEAARLTTDEAVALLDAAVARVRETVLRSAPDPAPRTTAAAAGAAPTNASPSGTPKAGPAVPVSGSAAASGSPATASPTSKGAGPQRAKPTPASSAAGKTASSPPSKSGLAQLPKSGPAAVPSAAPSPSAPTAPSSGVGPGSGNVSGSVTRAAAGTTVPPDVIGELRARAARFEALLAAAWQAGPLADAVAKTTSLLEARDRLAGEFERAGGRAAIAEMGTLDAALAADQAARETLRKLVPERDKLAARKLPDPAVEPVLVQAADALKSARESVRAAEARLAEWEAELGRLSAEAGDADEDALAELPVKAARAAELERQLERLGARVRGLPPELATVPGFGRAPGGAAAGATTATPLPAGTQTGPLHAFARLSTGDQERCRRAEDSLRELRARRTAAREALDSAEARCRAADEAVKVRRVPGLTLSAAGALLLAAAAGDAIGVWSSGDTMGVPEWMLWSAGAALPIAGLVLVAAGGRLRERLWRPADEEHRRRRAERDDADAGVADLSLRLRPAASAVGADDPETFAAAVGRVASHPAGADWLEACAGLAAAREELHRLRKAVTLTGGSLGAGPVPTDPDGSGLTAALAAGRTQTGGVIDHAPAQAGSGITTDPNRAGSSIDAAPARADELSGWLAGVLPAAEAKLALLRRRKARAADLERQRAEMPLLWTRADTARESFEAAAGAAGQNPDNGPDAAVAAVRSLLKDVERLAELQGRLIPDAESRRLPDEDADRKRKRRAALRDAVAAVTSFGLPADASTAAATGALRARQVKCDAAERDLAAARAVLDARMGEGAETAAGLAAALETVRRLLVETGRFEAAARTAREALLAARNEVGGLWAGRLNAVLGRLVPVLLSGYGGAFLKPDLSFTLKATGGRVLQPAEIDEKLSLTAADRLKLAFRLATALAGFPEPSVPSTTGSGGSKPGAGAPESGPPLLLDAVPGNEDPRRGAELRGLLAGMAPGRQVLLLSGDARRFDEWLRPPTAAAVPSVTLQPVPTVTGQSVPSAKPAGGGPAGSAPVSVSVSTGGGQAKPKLQPARA